VVAGTTNQLNQGLFTTVYRNSPPAVFVEAANLTGINTMLGDGWVGWADHDNDGDLDLLVSGRAEAPAVGRPFTQLYRNDSPVKNTVPSAPLELQAVISGTEVRLTWGPAFDAQTPTPGLTYNIRVGTKPGGVDVVSPMSRPDGWRMVVQRGNADHRLFSKVVGLKGGVYYWSVQAVDTAFAGGPFAPEATFVVPPAIQGITLEVDGTVRIAMLGAPNVAGYVVEGSTNLVTWSGVATLTADVNGQFSYVETNVSTIPVRYYRVHSP
jgi:hypothetical protein